MKSHVWFCIVLLNLVYTVFGDTFDLDESEEIKRLLNFLPFQESWKNEDNGVSNCSDPCEPDKSFIDFLPIEVARYETEQCNGRIPVQCTREKLSSKYPSMDGSCNNPLHPYWGMSNSCHRRILPHDYSDGISFPRKSCTGDELPNARVLSNVLHRETMSYTDPHSIHFMEWGQIVAHDLSSSDLKGLPEIGPGSCCDPYPRVDDDCIAVEVPLDDPFYIGKRNCLSLQRTRECTLCEGGVRQTLNRATSYQDLSLVYGNSENQSRSLRAGKDGLLLTQDIPGVGSLPPPIAELNRCKSLNRTHRCFNAGDSRIDDNPLLTVLHIILLRNHNNLCQGLKKVNPHWDDERLYQEGRKINIAQAQFITFEHFLPLELNPTITARFRLDTLPGNSYTTYDPRFDASVPNEFTDAALRYGHTMIPNSFLELDPVTKEHGIIFLRDYFLWPFEFYNGMLDRLTLGMADKHPMKHDLLLCSGVRNYLYNKRRGKKFEGSDLAATSIVRGREHGIPGYTYYLKHFFDYDVQSFCDLKRFIPQDTIRKMRKIYKSVHDVDLFTAGLAEYRLEGALVGPTFAALLIPQYWRMKFGNRYYFEHGGQAGSFSEEQLLEIKKTLYSRLLCDTTKIRKVQYNAFWLPSRRNEEMPCDLLPKLDLYAWKEQEEICEK